MSSPLFKPRWLMGHVLVVVISFSFVLLGFWQLSRHDDQRRANAALEAALATPPLEMSDSRVGPEQLEYQRVTVTGSYEYDQQLELRPRIRNGELGYNQVVPLRTDFGFVLVNRGFLPEDAGPAAGVPQYDGIIRVTGTVREDQGTSSFGPQNPDEGVLTSIARIDLERLQPQFDDDLYQGYLDLISESPEVGGLPTVRPDLPAPTNRPNLLYAIQWWLLAAVAGVGWVLFLRKTFFVSGAKAK